MSHDVWTTKPAKTFFKAVKRVNLDTSSIKKELKSLHANRISRTLKGSKITLKRIREAAAQEQSYRSRCVELMLESDSIYTNLNSLMEV